MDVNIDIDDLPKNLQRKLQRLEEDGELEKALRLTPKTPEMRAKIEVLREDLKDQEGRRSDQSVLEYAVNLAYMEFERRRQLLEKHQDAMAWRTGPEK